MRIIQTVNDTIRLLFNPKTELFCLSDFLLVRDYNENFLAQIVEIYDDKFDQEANVAKIRLVYRIVNGNEILPYDNYTPSRECEVAKIKQADIEKCINLNKNIINLGKSSRTKEDTKINTDFFENKCIIFADKFEQTNQIYENIAPELSKHKNVLILDFSGACNLEDAKTFRAGGNFKIPLNSDTIDYIQQKALLRAKLETQVVLGDVLEEIRKYLSSEKENYIPFDNFIKVIIKQCKQTPMVELLVLLSWLKKYSRAKIFAKSKEEFEDLLNSVKENQITSLDLSNVKTEWQKEYVEYIVNALEDDVFVLVRLNDNNMNNDILNTIYLKKKNISLIPSFSYGYKKAPYLMEFAQNYILMPTTNPKRNFVHANFQIDALNNESYMLYGDDTKGFIFILENKAQIKKRTERTRNKGKGDGKLFISLNLELEDMTALELRPDDFETKPVDIQERRVQKEVRLSDVLGSEIGEKHAPAETEYKGAFGEDELDYFEQNNETSPLKNSSFDEAENLDSAPETPIEEKKTDVEENIITPETNKTSEDEIIDVKELQIKEPEIDSPAKEPDIEDIELDRKFREILDEEGIEEAEELEKAEIPETFEEEPVKKEAPALQKLPVFTDEAEDELIGFDFKEKDAVFHEKYGQGNVLKVIKYGSRCLLQVEFPEVGKRLLDPKIAKLKPSNDI